MAVDTDFESPYFGHIYVNNGYAGTCTEAGATRTTPVGIYIMNAVFEDITGQGDTSWTGGVTWLGNGADPTQVTVGDDHLVYVSSWADGNAGIWTMDPGSPATDFDFLIDTSTLTVDAKGLWTNANGDPVIGSTYYCFAKGTGENRVLYASDEDVPMYEGDTAKVGIMQYNIGAGKVTNPPDAMLLYNATALLNGYCTFVPDGSGGWWFAQYRANDNSEVPALVHAKDNVIDWTSSGQGDNNPLVQGSGTHRGACCISKDYRTLYAFSRGFNGGSIIAMDVDVTNSPPTVTRLFNTPATGGTVHACATDPAGNIYSVSTASEHLRAFNAPTTTNSFTTPAPSAQKMVVAGAGVTNWEIM